MSKVTTVWLFEDRDLIYFKFPYNELCIKSFHQLPYDSRNPAFGRGWNKGGKFWVFPLEMSYQIELLINQCFEEIQWIWCDTMQQMLEANY